MILFFDFLQTVEDVIDTIENKIVQPDRLAFTVMHMCLG
jgi:hypothetical protein